MLIALVYVAAYLVVINLDIAGVLNAEALYMLDWANVGFNLDGLWAALEGLLGLG